MSVPRTVRGLLAACLLGAAIAAGAQQSTALGPLADALARVPGAPPDEADALLARIDAQWDPRAVPMAMDVIHVSRSPLAALRLYRILEQHTGQGLGADHGAWWQWMWNQDTPMHPDYPAFKSRVYALLDPRFGGYFGPDRAMTIRLDEVVWGGVAQDGIPPLRTPAMLPADGAAWLADDHVVFGIVVNGDARAYPRRILAWHELFTDRVGGVAVAGVYCTLCGAMILYHTEHAGTLHELGTSGFLYRSNKLMYDRATQSLWSTLRGEPVIGPLAGQGIRLARGSVVTTTWGEWRRRHPHTSVLSIDTGHTRDYAEGAAYRDYFASDALMFEVPLRDARLANKAEVLGLLPAADGGEPLAIDAAFLRTHPVHHERLGGSAVVIVTDASGANRVYASTGLHFDRYDGDRTLTGADGRAWQLHEDALRSDGRTLPRVPAHRAFWFGWHAAFPHTRLVK